MDKFFSSLVLLVAVTLTMSVFTIVDSKTDASTIKQGVSVLLKNVERQPAIGNNRE